MNKNKYKANDDIKKHLLRFTRDFASTSVAIVSAVVSVPFDFLVDIESRIHSYKQGL